MKREDIVARARSAVGHGTLYRLGAGAPFTAPHPWDEAGACDCSGFVCWVLGLSRFQPNFAFLHELSGGWLNTDGMVCDSINPTGYFEPASAAFPGDLIIYPSRAYQRLRRKTRVNRDGGPRIGHVGVWTGKGVVHCSSGNFRTRADAIAETTDEVFRAVSYFRYIRFSGVE